MDNDENLINNFANTLRDHLKQRTFSLYSENHSRNDAEKYEIKDVISSVAEQLKAIQNADSLKKCPSGKGITNLVKRSTFLPVNMVPVEHPPPQYQSHKFETQCVLDTQLINVIEDAEAIIDAEKGITQEFDTTFCYKDQDNCKIAQKPCTVFKNNHTIDKPKINLDSDKTTDWSMCDSKTVKHVDVVNGMTQEFDTTFCHKDLDKNIEENNDCHKNEQNDNIQVKNDNIHTENYRGTDCGIVGDTFKIKCDEKGIFVNELSLTKEKALTDVIIRNFAPETNAESNSIDICDNFDMQSNFYFGACEDDNNNFSQTEKLINHPKSKELEEPKSPILNNIRPKAKSNTPSSLIFELQSFENFEMIALPIIENYDFETAKRVINSQILNRELFIHSHAEAVLGDRDKNIQKNRPILKSYMKSEIPNAICTENKLNLTEDSMLFSSDEENDATNNLEEIPLKCNLQNSFDNETDTLEGTMYVGFQTASNKSIQIPTAPYHKAKTIFDNLVNIKKENRSETNFVEASETIATIRPWLQLNHVNMKSTTNIHADRFTTANSETLNMSQKTSNVSHPIPYCVDQVKNNGKNMSDDSGNLLQLHDLDISDNNKIKLSEKINQNQANSDPIANVQQNNKIKDNIFDKNYTEHLQIDDELMNDHILAEFNTDLIPDTNLNKIDKLTKSDKALKATNNVVKETELDLNLMKPINKDFVGFRTANKKMIKISAKGLMKTKNIFENIDNDDPLPRKSEKKSFECPLEKTKSKSQNFEENNVKSNINNSEVYFRKLKQTSILQGFKTAKQPVAISIQELNKAKKIFQNIDSKSESLLEKPFHCAQNVELNEFRKFTAASNKTVDISGSASAKTINIDIQNQDIENKQEIDNLFDIPACDTAVQSSKAIKNFTSASNTLVKISESAVAKTKHIIQEIDNERKKYNNESKVVSDDFDSMSKEERLFPNISQNAICEGFKTASNKFIKISTDPLIKTKKIFEDIFVDIDHKRTTTTNDESDGMFQEKQPCPTTNVPQNVVCQGFKTAANKPLGIPAKALAKSKNIFRDLNNEESNIVNNFDDVSKEKQPYPIGDIPQNVVCQGFKTASNKSVEISIEPLIKTKQVFQDISIDVDHKRTTTTSGVSDSMFQRKQPCPITNIPQNFLCQEFKTVANEPLGIPTKALAKSKKIFQDLSDEESNSVNYFDDVSKEKKAYPIVNISQNAICQGFKTAGNKLVKISTEPLIKTKQIFQDISIDVEHKRTTTTINDESDSMFQEKQPFPVTNMPLNVICQGFKTAANKPLGIPTEALAKSKKIFRDLNDEKSNIENDFDDVIKANQPYPDTHKPQNAMCQGFKTTGNKPVEISEEDILKSKKAVENVHKDCEEKQIRENVIGKQPEIVTKKQMNFIGFHTAFNKKVEVSENALLKSRQALQNIDSDLKSEHFDLMKTGNNTVINVSEEALRKCGNKFSESGVISEKDVFEDFNTEIIKDFEDTVCTEDFIKDVTPKGKRSGSPILSFPNTKKKKKFETPFITKKFVAPINRRNTIDTTTTDVYEFNENYKKIKHYTLKDVNKMDKLINIKNVDPYISNFQFETLLDFVFIRDRNDIDNDKWTTDKIKQYFSDSVNKRFIPDGWIENHLKMIIWKLVSYEIRFPEVMKNVCTVRNVLEQLKYRYKRELYNVERPALRKILEKDEVSTKGMVLCVAGLFVEGENVSSVTNQTQNIELLLTDGWYTIKASSDRMIDRLVCEGKITVGMKLAIHGAELLNCEQGKAPWEDTSSVRLKIWGNSTRRARWDARLGFHGRGAMPSRLSAVRPEGGRAARLRALVTRVYPTLYIEKYPDGSTLTRSERLEDIHQMKYETERQMQMERLYEELQRFSDQESQDSEGQYPVDAAMESGSQISRLMKKSRDREEFRAQLTSSQAGLLQQYASKQREKLAQDLQDRFRRLAEERGLDAPRNVVPLVKIRVADVETRGVTKAMVTIWKPNEILLEMLTEGTWIDLYNVVPTSIRYSEIQISAGRQSTFRISKLKETEQLQTITKTLKRQCYTTKDLQNPSMNTDYNEVDTVGLIFMIEPQTIEFEMKNHTFQNVYLTDADKNIICVNFWGGIEKFGFQNILETGQVVACVNLQKRAGNTRKTIPQYRATEFTYFTKAPKNESVRKMAADLTAKFSCLDKRKFIDDCVVLKNNYHNFKCGNIENVSPYRLNTSDYNVYKNKVFIDSPLVNKCTDVNFNLTGLDFESTFKQTDTQELSQQTLLRKRKVNEKIAKLKMYGEPPPLSTIHLINKSTIKSFKSPFTKSDISANVASPSDPHNRGENKSNADDCHQNRKQSIDDNTKSEVSPQNRNEYRSCVTNINALPQNRVDNIDSSPVYSLNRTYVKRPSINPVKLNFSNAIDTSITDPFGEDFDGSPPLSLDVNFIT